MNERMLASGNEAVAMAAFVKENGIGMMSK